MSGFANGRIYLDEERDTYYAGQLLTGKLEFQLNQTLDFKAINLIFHGEANVSWEEEEVEEYNGQRAYNTIQYGAQEVYFHVQQCVCGGVGVSQLQPGSHSIPFQFQLPPTIPSTFNDRPDKDEDEDGHIFYYIKGVLEYADGRGNEEVEDEAFDVVVPLDLNLNEELKTENEVIFEEALSSFFCGSGLLKASVTLPASGFCPGQSIPVRIEADNQSSVEISRIHFELVRRVKYISTEPPSEKSEPEESLNATKTGAVPAKTKRRFTQYIDVPALIPIITDNCGIIKVQYVFKMKLILSGCNDPLDDEIDIVLGQIPLHDLADGYKHPLQSDLPRAPVPPHIPPIPVQPTLYPSHTLQIIPNTNVNIGNYQTSAYPTGNSYPGANPGYPNANPYGGNSYPGSNSYPGGNPPYQANPPYPGGDAPYPSNPYPANPPYPTANPAFGTPAIGFVAPGMTSPSPNMRAPSPYNPSAPPE